MWVCVFTKHVYGVTRADANPRALTVRSRETYAYLSRLGETHEDFTRRMHAFGTQARVEARRVGTEKNMISDAWEWLICEIVPDRTSGHNDEGAIPEHVLAERRSFAILDG